MSSNGRSTRRYFGIVVAGVVWFGFVLGLVPNHTDSPAVVIALQQSPTLVSGPLGIAPLPIELVSLEVPPRTADSGELTIRVGAEQTTKPVSVGSRVKVGEVEYEMLTIRPWSGLLHRSPGTPMLNVAVKPSGAEWIENVFVERGGSRIATPEIAIVSGASEGGSGTARWGVVEGKRTHWFNSFVPGTGVELDDGTIVTLIARRTSGRILVEFAQGDAKSNSWFDANSHKPGDRIRYEDSAVVRYRLEVNVIDSDSFTVSLLEGDLEHWTRDVELGAIVVDEESGLSVRIDQNEREALPLFANESPWLELVLSDAAQVLRIREGEAVRIGEDIVSFEGITLPQPFLADLRIAGVDMAFDEDTIHESGGWRVDNLRVLDPSRVALRADYTARLTMLRAGLIASFLIGAAAYLYQSRGRT